MKNWALLMAGLYVLVLAVLIIPFGLLAFAPEAKPLEACKVYGWGPFWAWLLVMGVCQAGLLAVPVRLHSLRPVTRGPVWRTLLAGGMLAAFLAIGAALSLFEFIYADHNPQGNAYGWITLGLGLLTWMLWTGIFLRISRKTSPTDLVSRQCQLLFRGSILELLIAVPTHIVARYRDYCCAGFMTFVGLTAGFSVMLFAFGPAVLVLFIQRWKRLHPEPKTVDSTPAP